MALLTLLQLGDCVGLVILNQTLQGGRERLEGFFFSSFQPAHSCLSKVYEPEETACLKLMLSFQGVGGLAQCALIHFIVRYHRRTTATTHSQEELPCPTPLNYRAPPGGRGRAESILPRL